MVVERVSLAGFVKEVNSRSRGDPPGGRSPLILALAVSRVARFIGTPRSRVLVTLIVALSQGGREFTWNDALSLTSGGLAIAADVIEGRLSGWWPEAEWENATCILEELLFGSTHSPASSADNAQT
jgi:hypothetical protein